MTDERADEPVDRYVALTGSGTNWLVAYTHAISRRHVPYPCALPFDSRMAAEAFVDRLLGRTSEQDEEAAS